MEKKRNYMDKKASEGLDVRYRVNVIHKGKERFKYCRTLKRARCLQQEAIDNALCSIIAQKINGKYVTI